MEEDPCIDNLYIPLNLLHFLLQHNSLYFPPVIQPFPFTGMLVMITTSDNFCSRELWAGWHMAEGATGEYNSMQREALSAIVPAIYGTTFFDLTQFLFYDCEGRI